MKSAAIFIFVGLIAGGIFLIGDEVLAPRFLDSRIERLGEKGLPKAFVESGEIHFRMKADDFHLPLPAGSHALTPIITSGGFDTVNGTVQVQLGSSNQMTPAAYEYWISKKLQAGAYVTAEAVPGGLLINFHYFGDR